MYTPHWAELCMGSLQQMFHMTASCDWMVTLVACMCSQVISFNLGSMGFLTNHSYRNYAEDILGVINGDQDLGHCAMDQEVRDRFWPFCPRAVSSGRYL